MVAVLAVAAVALSACERQVTPLATDPDIVSLRIASAAEKAANALDSISGIEQQRAPQQVPPQDYANAPAELTQLITVKWTGPVEQICQTLAARAGYGFSVNGSVPGAPLIVNVDVYQKPLIEVLHDIGLQAGTRADVGVNAVNNRVEINYAPIDKI